MAFTQKRPSYHCANTSEVETVLNNIFKVAKKLKIDIKHDPHISYDLGGIGMRRFERFSLEITMGGLLQARDDYRTPITLLHELGHFNDYVIQGVGWREFATSQPRWQPEINAWEQGIVIGKQVGFTAWSAYFEHMIECLDSYSEGSHENAKVAAMELQKKHFGR